MSCFQANLQKKLAQLENSEAAAHSKAGELDVLNADLSQRLQAGLEERAMLAQHVQQLHGQVGSERVRICLKGE